MGALVEFADHRRFTRRVEIPALPFLPNAGTRGRHWATEARYRKDWHDLVAIAWARKRPPQPIERAEVTLVRHSKREPDADNLAASWKPVLDGLVRAGVLVDDSPAHVALESRWERTKGPGWVEMIVSETGPETDANEVTRQLGPGA